MKTQVNKFQFQQWLAKNSSLVNVKASRTAFGQTHTYHRVLDGKKVAVAVRPASPLDGPMTYLLIDGGLCTGITQGGKDGRTQKEDNQQSVTHSTPE